MFVVGHEREQPPRGHVAHIGPRLLTIQFTNSKMNANMSNHQKTCATALTSPIGQEHDLDIRPEQPLQMVRRRESDLYAVHVVTGFNHPLRCISTRISLWILTSVSHRSITSAHDGSS